MRVSLAAICERIDTRDDGRIDLIGAVPDQIRVSALPWIGKLTFALVLELGPEDDRAKTGMNVAVVRTSDGVAVGAVDPASATQPRQVPSEVDGPVHLRFELSLDVAFEEPGSHVVLVRSPDGAQLAAVAFGVTTRT